MRVFAIVAALLCAPAQADVTLALSIGGSPINLSAAASRASCKLPCAVFFDASATTASTTSYPFHEIQYTWNFGDSVAGAAGTCGAVASGEGYWACGSNPGVNSKNVAYGPVAAHVFESAGTFTVTATAYDGTNTATQTQTITVTDWTNDANTVCVSTSGDFTGCPSNATHASNTSSLPTACANITGSVKRLLFRAGEVWTAASTCSITAAGPGYIGRYGSGANPIFRPSTGISAVTFAATDWRVVDVNFDNNAGANTNTTGVISSGTNTQITFLRVNMGPIGKGINFSEFTSINDQIAVADSSITAVSGDTAGQNGMYIASRRFSVLGTLVGDYSNLTVSEHGIRSQFTQGGFFSNNTLRNVGNIRNVITIRAPTWAGTGVYGSGNFSEKIVISDNAMTPSSVSTGVASINPQNNQSDERIRNVVYERNTHDGGAALSSSVNFEGQYFTVRNNIMFLTATSANPNLGMQVKATNTSTGFPASAYVWFYNNSFYSSDNSGTNQKDRFFSINFGSTNIFVKNNVGYAPSAAQPLMVEDSSGVATLANNTCNYNGAGTSCAGNVLSTSPGYTTSPPVVPIDFKPAVGSYAIDGGVSVPVWSDFFNAARSGTYDLGAVNP